MFLNFMVASQKHLQAKLFLGGWGQEILGRFTGKSLYAQFHFTIQTTVEQISCQHHKLHGFIFDLSIGSLWAWSAVSMSNLFTYLFCRLV